MKVSHPAAKYLILDVLMFTDDRDENGNPIKRSSINSKHYRGFQSLKAKLIGSMEVGVVENDETSALRWVKFATLGNVNPTSIKGERHTSEEVVITDKEAAALKFYADQRPELPEVEAIAFDQFESILTGKEIVN